MKIVGNSEDKQEAAHHSVDTWQGTTNPLCFVSS